MIEQLRIGAHVFDRDGKQLGALSRIVVSAASGADGGDGADLAVTGLVVAPTTHLGELLEEAGSLDQSRDRSAPIALVREVNDSGVYLTCDAQAFAALPLFERHQYVDTPVEASRSRFRLGEVVNYLAAAFGLGAAPYVPENDEITFDLAPGADELPADAPVWRATPHEEIGVVERALADSATQHMTGLVIRRRGLDDRLVVVPVEAITSVATGVVHVNLTDEQLDSLPPYERDKP